MLAALALGVLTNSSLAAEVWYDRNPYTGWRGIYVSFEQPVEQVYVHITGMKYGRCLQPNSNVRVMRRISEEEVSSNHQLALNLGYKGMIGIGGEMGGSRSYRTPKYFYKYDFIDPLLSQVHYKIIYVRNGQHTDLTGWSPTQNHCTY